MQSATPKELLLSVWPLSLSLATTYEISVDFSSSPYLDVSVQEVPLIYLWIQYMIHKLLLCGLLHSDICGSTFAYNSPQLFAVNHVLLRFPMPRHPPCALLSFTICFSQFSLFQELLSWVLKYIVVFYPIIKNFIFLISCRFTWLYFYFFSYSIFKLPF